MIVIPAEKFKMIPAVNAWNQHMLDFIIHHLLCILENISIEEMLTTTKEAKEPSFLARFILCFACLEHFFSIEFLIIFLIFYLNIFIHLDI